MQKTQVASSNVVVEQSRERDAASWTSIGVASLAASNLFAQSRVAVVWQSPSWTREQRAALLAHDFSASLEHLTAASEALSRATHVLQGAVYRDAWINSTNQVYNAKINPVLAAQNRTTWPFLSLPPAPDARPLRAHADLPSRDISIEIYYRALDEYQNSLERNWSILQAHASKSSHNQRLVRQAICKLVVDREANAASLVMAHMADEAAHSDDALRAFAVSDVAESGLSIGRRWAFDEVRDTEAGAHSLVSFAKALVTQYAILELEHPQSASQAASQVRAKLSAELTNKVRVLVTTNSVFVIDQHADRVQVPEVKQLGFPRYSADSHSSKDHAVDQNHYLQSLYMGFDVDHAGRPAYLADPEYLAVDSLFEPNRRSNDAKLVEEIPQKDLALAMEFSPSF